MFRIGSDFEDVLSRVGDFERYQKLLILSMLLPATIWSSLLSRDVDYLFLVPDHWCRVAALANFSHGEQKRLIRPAPNATCLMFDVDYDFVSAHLVLPPPTAPPKVKNVLSPERVLVDGVPVKACDQGWLYDGAQLGETAATEVRHCC